MDNWYCCRGTFSGFFPGGSNHLTSSYFLDPFWLEQRTFTTREEGFR